MPTRTPDQRRSGQIRSTSTASIRKKLSCPKVRFCHTGSRANGTPGHERDQPPRCGPAERAAYHHDDHRQRAHRCPGPQRGSKPHRQQRQRHHQQRGDGRVGEPQPHHGVTGVIERQAVEHQLAAVLVDEKIREVAAERGRDCRGDDQDEDRGGPLQQAGAPQLRTSQHDRIVRSGLRGIEWRPVRPRQGRARPTR